MPVTGNLRHPSPVAPDRVPARQSAPSAPKRIQVHPKPPKTQIFRGRENAVFDLEAGLPYNGST